MKNLLYLLFTVCLFSACSSDDDEHIEESVSKINLSPILKAVYIGDTVQLTIKHFPTQLKKPNIYWESSDFEKGIINELGLFTAKDTGVVYLSARVADTNITDSIKVNILKKITVPPNNGGGSNNGNGSSNGSSSSTTSKRCAAKTKKGARCKRTADKGSIYCWQHR